MSPVKLCNDHHPIARYLFSLGLWTMLLLLYSPPRGVAAETTATHPVDNFSVTYPDNWHFHPNMTKRSGEPLVFTTFPRESFIKGGVIPHGDARIQVLLLPPGTDEYERLDQMSSGGLDVRRSGRLSPPPARVEYTAPRLGYRTTLVCPRINNKTYLVALDHYPNDPNTQEYRQALADVIASLSD